PGLQTNVQRRKTYKAKLVVFPRHARKFKAGDSIPEELANATQVQGEFLPIENVKVPMDIVNAYAKLRHANKFKVSLPDQGAGDGDDAGPVAGSWQNKLYEQINSTARPVAETKHKTTYQRLIEHLLNHVDIRFTAKSVALVLISVFQVPHPFTKICVLSFPTSHRNLKITNL
ncbi:hypothetical protein SOVF_037560, partial [Spinacia oleracea]